MVASKYREMQIQFEAWVAQIPDLQADLAYKNMFGGVMIYTAGKPCAIFWESYYALKLPADQQAELIKEAANDAGYDPSSPAGGQYITLPPSITGDEQKITYWIEDCLRYVQTLMPPKKRKKR